MRPARPRATERWSVQVHLLGGGPPPALPRWQRRRSARRSRAHEPFPEPLSQGEPIRVSRLPPPTLVVGEPGIPMHPGSLPEVTTPRRGAPSVEPGIVLFDKGEAMEALTNTVRPRRSRRGRSRAAPGQPAGNHRRASPPQLGLRGILAVWAAAALPMAFLAWVAAPLIADQLSGPAPLSRALIVTLAAGLVWQFVLVLGLVAREQGTSGGRAARRTLAAFSATRRRQVGAEGVSGSSSCR